MALTAKQEAFAQHFVFSRNNTAAFRHAYEPSPDIPPQHVHSEACIVRKNPKVAARILELERIALNESGIVAKLTDMLQREIAIATADPAELISTRVGNCRYCNGDGHGYQWRDQEFLDALAEAERDKTPIPNIQGGMGWRPFHSPHPDCPECGGAGVAHVSVTPTDDLSPAGRMLYRGVKQTRGGGLEVLTADQTKSAENVIRMLGGFKDTVNLTGALGLVAKVAELSQADPASATRAYEDFLKAGAA